MDAHDPFKGCWDRYDRAITHRDAAMALWAEFVSNEDTYDFGLYVSRERDGVGRGVLNVWQAREMPAMLPVLFGEYFYNLRAALDQAVYATAVIDNGWQDPPPDAGVLQYPVCQSAASWPRNAYHVRPLTERHQAWIESFQPYVGGEDPKQRGLFWLNHLARLDRHRSLRVVGAYVAESNPVVTVKAPSVVTFDEGSHEIFVEEGDGSVISRFTISPWQDGDDVEANPQTALELEIKDFWAERPRDADWLRMPMRERLFLIESVVETEVGRFEFDAMRRTRSRFLDKPGSTEPLA